jgi:hypothetical protein
MSDFFYSNPWALPATAGVVFGCLIPIFAIITEHVRKLRRAEMDHELKRDLLAQGKTADEIQTILETSSERGPWWASKAS